MPLRRPDSRSPSMSSKLKKSGSQLAATSVITRTCSDQGPSHRGSLLLRLPTIGGVQSISLIDPSPSLKLLGSGGVAGARVGLRQMTSRRTSAIPDSMTSWRRTVLQRAPWPCDPPRECAPGLNATSNRKGWNAKRSRGQAAHEASSRRKCTSARGARNPYQNLTFSLTSA